MPRRRAAQPQSGNGSTVEETFRAGFLRTEWLPTRAIVENPDNFREHPDDQIEAIRESIRANGFSDPLILNEETGLLLNGHGTLRAAMLEGMETVPVNVGRWTEHQAASLSLLLDTIPLMARINPARFDALRERMRAGRPAGEVTSRLLETMRADPFFTVGLGARMGIAPPPVSVPDPDPDRAPEDDGLRRVEIVCPVETLNDFRETLAEWSELPGVEISIA
jgi:hypothetical protein